MPPPENATHNAPRCAIPWKPFPGAALMLGDREVWWTKLNELTLWCADKGWRQSSQRTPQSGLKAPHISGHQKREDECGFEGNILITSWVVTSLPNDYIKK